MLPRYLLHFLLFGVLAATPAAGVVQGQVDDFQDGTLQGWAGGASPMVVATGGPDGVGDQYLQISADDSNLGTNNISQWLGDYLAADVGRIEMHLNNLGPNPLEMRLVLFGPGSEVYASANPTVLPAASGWVTVQFTLDDTNFTQTRGFFTLDDTLAGVTTLLIRHDPPPVDAPGTPNPVTGTLGIDNITALPEACGTMLLVAGLVALALLDAHRRRAVRRGAGDCEEAA